MCVLGVGGGDGDYLDHSVKSPFGVGSLRVSPEMVKPPKLTQSLPELAQLSQVF